MREVLCTQSVFLPAIEDLLTGENPLFLTAIAELQVMSQFTAVYLGCFLHDVLPFSCAVHRRLWQA